VVNDLGDDSELSGERTIVDEDDSADFDESLEGGRSLNGSHCCYLFLKLPLRMVF
jgi:hypothetical protein